MVAHGGQFLVALDTGQISVRTELGQGDVLGLAVACDLASCTLPLLVRDCPHDGSAISVTRERGTICAASWHPRAI